LAGALQNPVVMNAQNRAIRRILVPHDFSETAERALAFALDLADKLGARVTLMHAYEVPSYAFPEGPALTAEMAGTLERAARAAIEGVAERARRPGVELDIELRQGIPWSEIVRLAKDSNADLVVMGTHGRRGFARMLLGSVAEKVVRTAPCPVLTVHGTDKGPADKSA
jgi:nucleotide-binding universal stress UspA family protein